MTAKKRRAKKAKPVKRSKKAPKPSAKPSLRLLFDANPQPMYMFERETFEVIEVNQAAVEKYGYSREQFRKLHITHLRAPDQREEAVELAAGLKAGLTHVGPARHQLKDGRVIDVEITVHPLEWEGKEAVLVVTEDVTERVSEHKLAERLLHQQAAATKASLDGMAILDESGRFIYLNEAHARLYGYSSPADLIGKRWQALYDRDELARFEKEIMPAFWKAGLWHGEAVGRRQDATTFPQEVSLTAIEDGGLVCVVRDITQRKQAEAEHRRLFALEKQARAEAEAVSRAKDEFLAVVSHELRTPMTAILGWTWLLRSGDLSAADLARALDVIERNMKLQAQIIEDLLDVSSIVTGKLHLDTRPLDIGKILRAAADTVRSSADGKGVTLEIEAKEPSTVFGDPYRLQQVFWNLLSNSIKYNREGGHVWAALRVEGGCAMITVRDDGTGISPDFLPEVFEPFRQGENSLTRKHRGLGIGLAIVRHLVELHGGSVSASSAGPGKGSEFTVVLPLDTAGKIKENPPMRGDDEERADKLPHTLDGMKVLVVDDELDTVELVAELLRHCGAEVITALSAPAALESFLKDKPDLLVCDLAMPQEDGYSLIRKIRALGPERGGDAPALALTARAKDEDKDEALRAGFQLYLTKPVDPEDLVSALRELAGQPKLAN